MLLKMNCFIFHRWSVKLSYRRHCYEVQEDPRKEQNIVPCDKDGGGRR